MTPFPTRLLCLLLASTGLSLPSVAQTSATATDARRAATAIEEKRHDLGLSASDARLQPGWCRQEVRCRDGKPAACSASGDYAWCERLLGNDGSLLGAVCLGYEAPDGAETAREQVSVRQASCPLEPIR